MAARSLILLSGRVVAQVCLRTGLISAVGLFGGMGFVVAQASFFLQHLPLVAGVASLSLLSPVRASRTARIATGTAVAGLALLSPNELLAISAYDVATQSRRAQLIEFLYGPAVILIGVGLLVAGAALLLQGSAAFAGASFVPAVVLLLGFYVFFPLTPAIMGPFAAGRLAISVWMLLFAVLGYGLTRLDQSHG